MPQTTVQTQMDEAVAGMLGSASDELYSAESKHNESSVAFPNLALGTLVAVGTDEDGVLNLAAQADVIAGVVVRSQAEDPGTNVDLDTGDVLPDQMLTTLRRGTVWVRIEEDVDAGDPVRYRAVANSGSEKPGYFRTSDPTGVETVLITKGARFVRGGTALGLGIALLEIDVLNMTVTADS